VTPQPISDQTWAAIRAEFTLPTLEQVHCRLSELMEDPEPVMRRLVRVFSSTTAPSARASKFLPGGQLHPTVVELFGRALELDIPHNFTLWMITPSRALAVTRPVDHLKKDTAPLLRALESYACFMWVSGSGIEFTTPQ
jgi:hypothetical protein